MRHLRTACPPEPVLERLRGVSLFAGCTDQELAAIDRLACQDVVPAGSVLCRQGAAGRQAFVVVDGEAEVTVDGVAVAHVGPGSFIGEMAVLDGEPRVGTVTATTDMTVLVFTASELREMLEIRRVWRRMLSTLSNRLRVADRMATRSAAPSRRRAAHGDGAR